MPSQDHIPQPRADARAGESAIGQWSTPSTMLPSQAATAVIAAAGRWRRLSSLAEIDGEGLLQAAADLERTPLHERGPLHGMPIGVKDNIDVAGFATTAGSPAMPHPPVRSDAPVVHRLRAAGALIAAKTSMHELGLGVTSVNSWSGPVRNPHNPDMVAGGSSGGSAAAVAAGILPMALGTDTGGSIRIPAALCGVVGFRPTTGRWPLNGVVPISRTRDVVGPIARTVAMCALADEVVCGRQLPPEPRGRRVRVGIPRALWIGIDPAVGADCFSAVRNAPDELLQRVEVELPIDLDHLLAYGLTIAQAETLDSLGQYHRQSGHDFNPRSFASSVQDPVVRGVLQELAEGGGPHVDDYVAALQSRDADRDTLSGWLNDERLDFLCFPAVAAGAVPVADSQRIELDGVTSVFSAYTRQPALASVLGLPAITIPVGRDTAKMPVGLEIVGRAGSDRSLLSCAERIETLTDNPTPEEDCHE